MNKTKLAIKVMLALSLATTPAFASQIPSYDMGEIIISADAYRLTTDTETINIKVVSPGKTTSIPDILRQVSGIDVQQRTPYDNQDGTVKLRGFDTRRFTVLVDGRPISMSGVMGGNYVDWNAIPLDQVEKIQIIKGAKTAQHGNTLGGVINIITKDAQTAGGTLETGMGENGQYQYRLHYGASSHDLAWNIYGSKFGRDAFLRNNSYDADQYGFTAKYRISPGDSLKANWHKTKEHHGMIIPNYPGGTTGYDRSYPVINATDAEKFLGNIIPNPGAYWEKNFTTYDATWSHKTTQGFIDLTYWKNDEKRREVNYSSGAVSLDRTVVTDLSRGWQLKGEQTAGRSTYAYGAEYKQLRYGYGWYTAGSGMALYPSQKVNLFGSYLEKTWSLDDRWTGNIGLRYDKMTGRPDAASDIRNVDHNALSPKLNFSFRNDQQTTTFISVNRLWRSPSMAEFYWWSKNYTSTDPKVIGDGLMLNPEKGWEYELGVERKVSPQLTTKLTAYYQNINDYINFTHQYPYSCYNIPKAKLWGVEWENSYQLNQAARVFLNYTNQHTKKEGVDPSDNLGLRHELDYRPRHKATLGYQYDAKPWHIRYTVDYTGEQSANYPYGTPAIIRLGGYVVHDLAVTRDLTEDSSLTLSINNLFDKHYAEQNNYPMPGRLVSVVYRYKL
ncbi:TonB-dependent receptor [Thermosinus carboxydivorans Nor1]|uniref:TonB-dependent receptor n=1 Tax=Thermosinus carboxydivorans Nor1 TaxID=401526 RepID=A1HR22_9FIRM|nr:TonB-dependent receptor [Thermosinus carboxydivorans]EAX47529.1 TonB-dependent receptor [Thermosinus carboxydivorans Nor1]